MWNETFSAVCPNFSHHDLISARKRVAIFSSRKFFVCAEHPGLSGEASQPYRTTSNGTGHRGLSDSGLSTMVSAFSPAPPPISLAQQRAPPINPAQTSRQFSQLPSARHHGQSHKARSGSGSYSNQAPPSRDSASNSRNSAAASSHGRPRLSSLARHGVTNPADDAVTTVMYRYGAQSTEYFMTKLTGRATLGNFKAAVLSKEDRTKQFR